MLQRPVSATNHPVDSVAPDKENDISQVTKTPRTGLKLAGGVGQRSGKVSPAASPSSKKMKLSSSSSKLTTSSALKSTGLRDITNSALKPKVVTIVTGTDSISPRLLESKKRALPSSLGAHPVAPPSKLHIMNTASELDFSSMPDEKLPEIERVAMEPEAKRGESSDDDFFEQYDFTYLTQLTATSFPGDQEGKKIFESEFESELSNLSIDSLEESKASLLQPNEIKTNTEEEGPVAPIYFTDIPESIFTNC